MHTASALDEWRHTVSQGEDAEREQSDSILEAVLCDFIVERQDGTSGGGSELNTQNNAARCTLISRTNQLQPLRAGHSQCVGRS